MDHVSTAIVYTTELETFSRLQHHYVSIAEAQGAVRLSIDLASKQNNWICLELIVYDSNYCM